jgi:soluble lytic murein transglycosylase-like protein
VIRALFARRHHSNKPDNRAPSNRKIAEESQQPDLTWRKCAHRPPADKSHLNKKSAASLRKVMPIIVITGCTYAGNGSAFCWNEAGARYRISAAVLQSIGRHESGLRPTAMNRNRNGTVDVGVMQINSVHFAELQSYGIAPNALWDPCTNVMVGAYLLARSIQKYGNTWEAVGAYHSRTPGLKERYAMKVYGVFAKQSQSSRGRPTPPTSSR